MWQSIVKDEIWVKQDFLPPGICEDLCRRAGEANTFRMAPGEGIRKVFDSFNINPTLYDYTIHYAGVRKDEGLQGLYKKELETFFQSIGFRQPVDFESGKLLQFFLKSFSENSFYEAHVEPVSRYGDFAFVHFLEDCEGGELVFPDEENLKTWLSEHPRQAEVFHDMKSKFVRLGEPCRVIGPAEILPRRNDCVIFRTGSVHWVNRPRHLNSVQRLVVTGWPFVTPELISDLNKGCELDKHFRDG